MQGLHLTADLYDCACDPALLIDAGSLAESCRRAVAQAGLTLVDENYFTFPSHQGEPGGVTGAVLLAESHLAIHTWPERAGVTLDVYVCNFSTDNSGKAEALMADLIGIFEPARRDTHRLLRGGAPNDASGELLLEWINDQTAYGFRSGRRLAAVRSRHQMIEVYETAQFGRLFRLDGCYMTSERDEFFYHEPLVHCAALAHPAPRRALVLGGGDGGSTEELLKHPTIEQVRIVELDEQVVQVARQFLTEVHRGAFDDPRVRLTIDDGAAFVERCDERFDLIVLDLTDPDTPARQLYTAEFFARAKALLAPGGALTLHIGSPVFTPQRVGQLVDALRSVFAVVRPLGLFVPLYGSYWGMAVASDSLDPLALDAGEAERRIAGRRLADLRYYNGEIHQALFVLPNFYRDLLSGRRGAGEIQISGQPGTPSGQAARTQSEANPAAR